MRKRLCYLVGSGTLSDRPSVDSAEEDVWQFLWKCRDENFLDFIEFIFRIDAYHQLSNDPDALVRDINEFLLVDDLPFALTPFVREKRTEDFYGRPSEVCVISSYPQVVIRSNQVSYAVAVEPAIHLLRDASFAAAEKEFLGTLEDYRHRRYGDCLTKCGSALESTMKLICARKGWPYKETDTAATLLKIVLTRSGLESFFEQPLLTIATLRNRLSTSHGGGATPRSVSPQKARYAINATASAILLLVEECR